MQRYDHREESSKLRKFEFTKEEAGRGILYLIAFIIIIFLLI